MSVVKAAFTVGSLTLCSRFVGFLRECIMAFSLGAGIHSDAMLVALRIANTFRRIFAEGAFNASFLPRFSKTLHVEGQKSANKVLSDIFSLLLIVLFVISVIVVLFFPNVLHVLVSGFDVMSKKFGLTVNLGRICFPYLIFISITSLFAGVLNAVNKFALAAGVYSLLSVFTSVGLLFSYFCNFSKSMTVYIVAFCVLFSGVAQMYVLFVSIKKHNFLISFHFNCWSKKTKDIVWNMIPGIIGAGVWQLNLLVDTCVCSYFPTGVITCVNLADRLNQFPLGTLGIAMSTALLPLLSRYMNLNQYDKMSKELERGLLFASFLTFYATAILTTLSYQSVAVAFQRGLFGVEQVTITADVVVGFAIGLPAYVLTKIFSAVYFASGDTKSPVVFGIYSVGLNIVFIFLLLPFLKYFGLALCTSLSAIANAVMLIYFLNKRLSIKFDKTFWIKLATQLVAGVVTGVVLRMLVNAFWTKELGGQFIKWLIYFGFLGVSIFVFFFVTIIGLLLTKQSKWKIWKKSAWS